MVINARHELILIRARNDNNYIVGDPATEPMLELFKVQWRMSHALNEVNKLLRALENEQYLSMSFRRICMNIPYYRLQRSIPGPSRLRLS